LRTWRSKPGWKALSPRNRLEDDRDGAASLY
jgi:hypothetical protein